MADLSEVPDVSAVFEVPDVSDVFEVFDVSDVFDVFDVFDMFPESNVSSPNRLICSGEEVFFLAMIRVGFPS